MFLIVKDFPSKRSTKEKLPADFLSPLLTKVIKMSIRQNVFPENAKTASVIPLDKGKPNKERNVKF